MENLILAAALIWTPLIPLRILLHAAIPLWRRFEGTTFWIFFIYWAFVDVSLYNQQALFIYWRFPPFPTGQVVGLILVAVAVFLQYRTIRTLGLSTFLTRPEVTPKKTKSLLIITGPYRWVRHPFYLFEWLLLAGLTFLTSAGFLLVLLLLSLITIPLVTIFEERELVDRFGDEYQNYQREVPRLIPRWRAPQ